MQQIASLTSVFSRLLDRSAVWLTVCVCAVSTGAGCMRLEAPPEDEQPIVAGTWQELERDFKVVLAAAKKGDAEGVVRAFEPFFLTREEMITIYGPEKGPAVWTGYETQIIPDLRREAPAMMIARVKEGLTEVYSHSVGPAYPRYTTAGDKLMLDAMRYKSVPYTIWLRKPGEELGMRFNAFVYINKRWKCLFKSYDFLPKGAKSTPADAGPAIDAGAGPAVDAGTAPAADAGTEPAPEAAKPDAAKPAAVQPEPAPEAAKPEAVKP